MTRMGITGLRANAAAGLELESQGGTRLGPSALRSASGLWMEPTVQTAENDQIEFMLEEKEDGVWLHHPDLALINLGPLKPVCDELFRFLETVDFCE